MSGVNRVFLLGNLGQDPDVRYTSGGSAVANLSLATGENFKDKDTDEWKEKTEWHRIVLFGRLAEVAEKYLTKGARLHIEGKLQTRKWQDRDGADRYTTEVVANNLLMLGSEKSEGRTQQQSSAASGPARHKEHAAQETFDDSDIPF